MCVVSIELLFVGSLPDSALRATLCGTDNPGTVYIRTHQAYIRFHTDHHLQNIGFTLEYQISEVTGGVNTKAKSKL